MWGWKFEGSLAEFKLRPLCALTNSSAFRQLRAKTVVPPTPTTAPKTRNVPQNPAQKLLQNRKNRMAQHAATDGLKRAGSVAAAAGNAAATAMVCLGVVTVHDTVSSNKLSAWTCNTGASCKGQGGYKGLKASGLAQAFIRPGSLSASMCRILSLSSLQSFLGLFRSPPTFGTPGADIDVPYDS